jgi:hypothetical protein
MSVRSCAGPFAQSPSERQVYGRHRRIYFRRQEMRIASANGVSCGNAGHSEAPKGLAQVAVNCKGDFRECRDNSLFDSTPFYDVFAFAHSGPQFVARSLASARETSDSLQARCLGACPAQLSVESRGAIRFTNFQISPLPSR